LAAHHKDDPAVFVAINWSSQALKYSRMQKYREPVGYS
jgi:hypothetical protein